MLVEVEAGVLVSIDAISFERTDAGVGVVSEREISFVAAYDGCTLTLMFYCYCSAAIA